MRPAMTEEMLKMTELELALDKIKQVRKHLSGAGRPLLNGIGGVLQTRIEREIDELRVQLDMPPIRSRYGVMQGIRPDEE
jgi:hypothetical protein